jgi:DNA-binding GntR family transcriptional regulator
MDLMQSDAHSGYSTRRAFYAELYSHANRPRMRGLILQLRDNVGRYHVLKDVRHSVDAHEQLRRHIMDRNPDNAAEVVVAHLEETRDDLLATMAQDEHVPTLTTEGS